MTDQEVSGGNAVDSPKRDFVVQGHEEVKATEAEKVEEPTKTPDGDDKQADQKDQGEGKKRKGGWQRKIEALEAQVSELQKLKDTPKEPAKQAEADEKPTPDKFTSWDEYNEALIDWTADQKIKKAIDDRDKKVEAQAKEEKARNERRTLQERYEDGVEKAREAYDDFDDLIDSYDGPMTVEMQQELLHSEVGPEIMYHLSKPENRNLAQEISQLTVGGMIKAIGKLEVQLSEKSAPAVKTTKAPPPITPVKSKSSGTLEFREGMPYDDFKRWEKTQR